jgi:hypothetical protein
MPAKHLLPCLCVAIALVCIGCAKQSQEMFVLQGYPLDADAGIITQSDERTNLSIDRVIFAEGTGSLKITATEPVTVQLFEVGDIDAEKARLIYQAKLRTEGVDGRVYLEMWCHFPDEGDFFSRGLETPLMGDTDWVTVETPFFLKKGQNPDNVKLNLVIEGTGWAWIDDIRLMKGPLK